MVVLICSFIHSSNWDILIKKERKTYSKTLQIKSSWSSSFQEEDDFMMKGSLPAFHGLDLIFDIIEGQLHVHSNSGCDDVNRDILPRTKLVK